MGIKNLYQDFKNGQIGFKMEEVMTGQHWFEPECGPAGLFPNSFLVCIW